VKATLSIGLELMLFIDWHVKNNKLVPNVTSALLMHCHRVRGAGGGGGGLPPAPMKKIHPIKNWGTHWPSKNLGNCALQCLTPVHTRAWVNFL
jgi:hypothetical protein